VFGEEKESCVACGDVWYSKHYKDGFCYNCQENGAHKQYLRDIELDRLVYTIIKRTIVVFILFLIYIIYL